MSSGKVQIVQFSWLIPPPPPPPHHHRHHRHSHHRRGSNEVQLSRFDPKPRCLKWQLPVCQISLSLSLDDDDAGDDDEEDDDDDDGDEDGDDDEDDGYDDDQTKMLQVCQISPEIIKRNFTLYFSNQFAIRFYLKTNPHWMGVL